jgi:hypothetical protein
MNKITFTKNNNQITMKKNAFFTVTTATAMAATTTATTAAVTTTAKAALRCLCFVLVFCGLGRPLAAQFYYAETCRNATGAFQYHGNAPGYTAGAGGSDAPGDGWLRLTDIAVSQRGYVLLDGTFPSNIGVTIEFDFKIWTSSSTAIGDGFSVFLFDGDPDSTFVIGVLGGGLGYYNLRPAYLGVGIDEYGNFSAASAGPNSPGKTQHSIVVRDAAFSYVAGTGERLGSNTFLGYETATQTRPTDATMYRVLYHI